VTFTLHRSSKRVLALVLSLLCMTTAFLPVKARADNPIVQHVYTADPAPLVYNGRVYLYTGHDEDNSTYFTMRDWRVWSSSDMVNWTDHGSPMSLATFSWAGADAWAGQAVYRNGKFYWYVPVRMTNGSQAIGVGVSDSPTGPFHDALGGPLIQNSEIDPTVYIDDDGQAYLYYGNPNLWYVRLNADMISYSGSPTQIPLTTAGFGTRTGDANRPTLYEEGPWFYKRNGLYYMVFAAKCCSEFIAYSTSPGPTGPWTYRGTIMPTQGSSFTNHPGVIDFNGGSYFFYHNGALPGGGGFTRSVAVEKFSYNADGTIPTINMTTAGAPQAGTLDPTFVPCLQVFQGFPNGDTTQAANYVSASGSACPGPLPSTLIFGLQVPRHFVVPSTQQWNLTVQRALGKQWVLEVGYIGTHAVHLRETRDNLQSQRASVSSPAVVSGANCDGSSVGPAATCSITTNTFGNAVARSRVQGINGYAGFQLFANDAYSHYHSLQTSLSRRWNAGYFQAAYTFSKSTDATSSGNTAFNTAFNDESTLDASRGLSDFDRTHRFVVSYRYDLPFYKGETGWKAAVLTGWALSGITIFQSGTPFSVTDSGAGSAFLGLGFTPGTLSGSLASGSTLATAVTKGDIHNRIDGYLNVNALTTAPLLYPAQCLTDGNFCTTDFGNLGRNVFRGPYQQNWDFGLIKNFKLTERQSLRFTTDFFNIWNHTNFGNPTLNDVESIPLSKSPFGKIISTVGTPRLIQFSLRYAF